MIGFLAAIALPAVVQLLDLEKSQRLAENRVLASLPAIPRSYGALLQWPAGLDAYLRDHFGLRQTLVRSNNWIRYNVFREIGTDQNVAGRNGRLFFANHTGAPKNSLLLDVCGVGVTNITIANAGAHIAALLEGARNAGLLPTFLIVPTAARLYAEDIPQPLAGQCGRAQPSVDRLVAGLAGTPVGRDVVYPLSMMVTLKQHMAVIPSKNFHWDGEGPLRVAEAVAGGRWGMARSLELPLRPERLWADVNSLYPGMRESSRVLQPNMEAVGVSVCRNDRCSPVEGIPVTAEGTLTRYSRPGGSGRLLVLTDSFGEAVAGDFIEFFSEVWHVNTNLLEGLSPADRLALVRQLVSRFHGEHVLYVFHDWGALVLLGRVVEWVWPPEAANPGRLPRRSRRGSESADSG